MKAVVFSEFGGVDKLKFTEVAKPKPAFGEVLVRVEACALNHLDIWVRRGLRGRDIPMPHILGSDIAGVVEELGEGVEGLSIGEKVVVAPGVSCGRCPDCLSGRDNLCDKFHVIGVKTNGGYAEYTVVPASNILPKPQSLSFEEASSIPLTFLTAWHMLVTKASVSPGKTVLVVAAGSGVGSAAVQIAKLFNAKVIATAGSEEKISKARRLGADEAINHYEQDFAVEARRLTNGRGVDIVIDSVGEATWSKSIQSLAKGGIMVSCGVTGGSRGEVDILKLYMNQATITGIYLGTKSELRGLLKFFDEGKLKPTVDRVLPLREASKAHELLEQKAQFGKIVLNPKV